MGRAQLEGASYEAQLTDLLRGMKNGSSIQSTDKERTRAERVMTVGAEEVAGSGVLIPETCETVEVDRESADRETLKKDEVVIVARGNLAGKAARPPDDLVHGMIPNTSLIRLEVNTEKVEPTYLVHSIMSDRVQSLLSRRKSQLSSSRIRQQDLKEMKVPMVPKSIQEKFEQRLTSFSSFLRSQYQSDRLIEEMSDSILGRFN
jgi:restriction endonuclease S subunit